MKKTFILALFILLVSNINFASNWHSLGYGVNNWVNTIFVDSSYNKIYAGGGFYMADSIRALGIAVWDGLHWDSLADNRGITNEGILAITKYQNQIYSDGEFNKVSGVNYGGRFNGVSWDTLGYGVNGHLIQLKEINGLLWVGGFYDKSGNNSCWMVSTWDGSNWNCLNLPYNNDLEDFEFYNGNLVIGGNIHDSTGSNIVDIAYYDSSSHTWGPLGGGLHGGWIGVHAITIYRGDLYIAGLFSKSAGNAGDNIMRWDGSQWHDVGGGTDAETWIIRVFNDELYAGGNFNYAGGIYTGCLAKWNGSQWMPVSSSAISGTVRDIQFYNNELYVGGAFTQIDSVTVNNIARYDGPLGTNDLEKQNLNCSLSPNPATNQLAVSSSRFAINSIYIYDVLGQKMAAYHFTKGERRKEIDISALAQGVYFVVMESEEGRWAGRFIKQ